MGNVSLMTFFAVDGVAKRLASLSLGSDNGIVTNVILGAISAFVAGLLLPIVGLRLFGGILGHIADATIGALLVALAVRFLRKI